MIGELVGTATQSQRVDEETLERTLLWTVWRANASLQYTDAGFEQGYRGWLAQTLAREERLTILAPLAGITFTGQIDLPGGLVIGRLGDDEIESLLGVRLVPDVFGAAGFVVVSSRAALRTEITLHRGVQTDLSDEDRVKAVESPAKASDALVEVVDALRVYKRGRVRVTGVAMRSADGSSVWTLPTGAGVAGARGPTMELEASEAASFVGFWKSFTSARRNSAIDAVIRRFSYAGERSRPDDEIVDLVAALEALLLSEIDNRTELKFRTALRGALFIEGSGLDRREVQKQLRRAYNVRSAVAHGGAARTNDLKSATNETQTLDEFVASTEDLVRLAVRRAVECTGSGASWPPDWDGLALGEAVYQ